MEGIPEFDPDPLFNEVGDYKPTLEFYNRNITPSDVDYESLRSKFVWLPTDIIKQTFEKTTQYY